MEKTKTIDDKIMKLLGVTVIRRLICNTNKGPLELMTRKGESKYFLTLDSIPLGVDANNEIMDLMYKKEVLEPSAVATPNMIVPKKKSYYKSKKKVNEQTTTKI